jgi:hypothetical protein
MTCLYSHLTSTMLALSTLRRCCVLFCFVFASSVSCSERTGGPRDIETPGAPPVDVSYRPDSPLVSRSAIVASNSPGTPVPSSDAESAHGQSYFDHAALDPTLVHGHLVNDARFATRPTKLRYVAGRLWVRDPTAALLLHALDAETGELLFSGGKRGENAGDFVSISSFSTLASNPSVVRVFDPALQRVTDVLLSATPSPEFTTRMVDAPAVWQIVWFSDERGVGISPTADERFVLFSPDGARHTRSGPLLGDANVDTTERIKASFSMITLCESPGVPHFVIAYSAAGRIELYDSAANLVRTFSVPFPSDAVFESTPHGSYRHRHVRSWYVDCTGARKHLYALFSGRSRAAFDNITADSGEFVHVFTWSGRLARVLKLDQAVRGISVTPDERRLYAVSMLDGNVYRYDLEATDAESRRTDGDERLDTALMNVSNDGVHGGNQ